MTALALTAPEKVSLVDCESVIERGVRTFVEVGTALAQIRDGRLYREDHGTFEEYCNARWSFTPQHAGRLMIAAEVVAQMEPIGSTPTNEAQARELASVPAEQRAEVWRETVERTDGKPTAAAVREVRNEIIPPAPAPEDVLADVEQALPATLDQRVPGWRGDVDRSRLRARWSRAVSAAADIPLIDPEFVASELTEGEAAAARIVAREITKWIEKFDRARQPALRVVTGADT